MPASPTIASRHRAPPSTVAVVAPSAPVCRPPVSAIRYPVFRVRYPVFFRRLAFGATLLLSATGCAHYHLGTGGQLAFHSLYVAPVQNKSLLPQAQAIVTTQLREALARDGRVTLAASPDSADATLTVVLNDYHRDVAAVREGDTGLARKFNLILGAACTLHDNRANRTLFENRPVSATREAFTDLGQLQAEYQTLPLLAETLADKVAHATLDVW